ncbi:MAG: YqcC family protein [Phycisphaerae bacterium]
MAIPTQDENKRADAARLAEQLEAELRRLGVWRQTPFPPEAMQFQRAFGGDTMPFEHWIQAVLIPSLRQVAVDGQMPQNSSLMAYAVREFDGREDQMWGLINLLGRVDDLCPSGTPDLARTLYARDSRALRARTIFAVVTLAWAGVCILAAGYISNRVAGMRPDRVLVHANYRGQADTFWRGLSLDAWATGKRESLHGEHATLALPGTSVGGATRTAGSIEIEFASPTSSPVVSEPNVEFSAVGLTRWASANADAQAADPVATSVISLLESLRAGTDDSRAEAALRQLGATLGDTSEHAFELTRYPAASSTGVFFGAFCALFLPPMLVWMVRRHQRNMSRR